MEQFLFIVFAIFQKPLVSLLNQRPINPGLRWIGECRSRMSLSAWAMQNRPENKPHLKREREKLVKLIWIHAHAPVINSGIIRTRPLI
jgi:hypothetical protein